MTSPTPRSAAEAGTVGGVTAPAVRARPFRTSIVCTLSAVVIVVVSVVVGVLLKQSEAGTSFHTSDQVAIIVIGVLIAGGFYAFTLPRVTADAERIVVRNVLRTHVLRWPLVEGISFPDGAAFPVLQLHDDETVTVLAIQAVDGERADRAVNGLRTLLAADQHR